MEGSDDSSSEDDPFITKEQREDEKEEIIQLCRLIKNKSSIKDIEKYLEKNVPLCLLNYCYKKWTPLLYATVENRLDVCELLVKKGCDVNFIPQGIPYTVSDLDYRLGIPELSPFMMSCLRAVRFEIFELYFKSGGEVNSSTPRDETTPLMFLVTQKDWWKYENYDCGIKKQKQKLKMILDSGGDVTIEDKYEENVLHHFTLHTPVENELNTSQSTSLQNLVANETNGDEEVILEMLQLILDRGIDVNKRNLEMYSSLRTAAVNLQRKRMCLFIKHGADVNELRDDKSLIHELGIFPSITEKDSIVIAKFKESLKCLLEEGLDINTTTFNGDTVLHQLIDRRLAKAMIEIVLQSGGDVHQKNWFGYTPLHTYLNWDFSYKTMELIRVLLNAGADINVKTIDGLTPLMIIIQRKLPPEFLTFILDRNAQINDTDKFGRTALHHCIIVDGSKEIFKMLIDCKIDTDVGDVFGKKAVYYTRFLNEEKRRYFQQKLGGQRDSENLDQRFEYISKIKELKEYFKRYEYLQLENQPFFNKQSYVGVEVVKNTERMIELLESPGIGSVSNITETTMINDKIEQLINTLCLHLSQSCDFGYRYEPKLSGSVSEGTKVGLPDEYDYFLFIDVLCDQLTPEVDENTKQGYVMLKFKQDSTNLQISTDSFFDAEKFNLYFYKLMGAAIGSVFAKNNDFYLSPYNRAFLINKAALSLSLKYPSRELDEIKISIDLVPAVKLPIGWCPTNFNNSVLKESHLCVALMKPAKGRKERLRFSFYKQLRISTSLLETRIISQELPSQIKRAFIALKAINDYNTTCITTYAIKNAVMNYAKDIENHDSESLFKSMIRILSRYSTLSFFFNEMKIVDDPYLEQMAEDINYLLQFIREVDAV